MTSKRSIAALTKRAKRRSAPFSVVLGDETVTGTFTALPFMRWQELLADHPPRDGNAADAGWQFCVQTFWPALIKASATFDKYEVGDEDWDAIFDTLTQAQMVELGSAAYVINVHLEATAAPLAPSESPETTSPNSD